MNHREGNKLQLQFSKTKRMKILNSRKAVPTTTVLKQVEIGHRQHSLHCSRTLEGLIIYGLSPRNNDLAQTGNPISSIFLTWFAISQGIVKGWQFFLGRHCLPASLKHVNCWNLHERYDSSSLTKVGSETRLVKLIFFN